MTVIERWTIMFGHDGPDWAVEGHGVKAFPEVARLEVVDVESYDALAEQLQGAVEELRALLDAADVEAQSQFEAPDRLREAILRADAWLTANGGQ